MKSERRFESVGQQCVAVYERGLSHQAVNTSSHPIAEPLAVSAIKPGPSGRDKANGRGLIIAGE